MKKAGLIAAVALAAGGIIAAVTLILRRKAATTAVTETRQSQTGNDQTAQSVADPEQSQLSRIIGIMILALKAMATVTSFRSGGLSRDSQSR